MEFQIVLDISLNKTRKHTREFQKYCNSYKPKCELRKERNRKKLTEKAKAGKLPSMFIVTFSEKNFNSK